MALGQIAFLGSGETSLAGGRIFESLARRFPQSLRIAILETPAGFELNANLVAGRVAGHTTRLARVGHHPRTTAPRGYTDICLCRDDRDRCLGIAGLRDLQSG